MNIYDFLFKKCIYKKLNFLSLIILLTLCFFLFPKNLNAELPGYASSSTVTINNDSNPSTLNNHQILLIFNTQELITNNELKSDGSDLRFLDSDDLSPLSYWIESGLNTDSTKVWVKIPEILASSQKTIHMYYNNPSASPASNGTSTFDFFDDFNSINPALWTKTHASITSANSKLSIINGALYTPSSILPSNINMIIESNISYLNSNGSYSGFMIGDEHATAGSNSGSDALLYYMTESSNGNMTMSYWAADGLTNNYNLGSGSLFASTPLNTPMILSMVMTSNNTFKFYRDYTEILSRAGTWDAPFYLWTGYFTGSSSGGTDIKDIEIDWIRVRKYTEIQPTAIVNFPINKLVFRANPDTIIKNNSSTPFTIETQNINGNSQKVSSDTILSLSSNSATGEFSISNSPFIPVSQITLPLNTSSISFYYRDSETGLKTITVSENPSQNWTDASKTVQIITYAGQNQDEDLSPWLYSGILQVTNPSASLLSDFQIMLEINTEELIAEGKMNIDGNDIRFTTIDGTIPLPYWIESGINSSLTRIWIKAPILNPGSNQFLFYYGNLTAPPISNGITTFDFFDHFDTFNSSLWSKTHASSTVSASKLIISNGAVYTSSTVLSTSTDKMVEANILYSDSIGSYTGLMIGNDNRTAGSNTEGDALLYYMTQPSNGNMMLSYWAADGLSNSYNLGNGNLFTAQLNTPIIFSMLLTNGNTFKFFKDYSEIFSRSGSWNAPFYIWAGYFTGSASANTDVKNIEIDWIRVRKYYGFDAISSVILPVTKLSFATPSQNIFEDRASSMIIIKSLNDVMQEQPVLNDTLIRLSSSSLNGTFSLLSSPFIPINEVLISGGTSSASFYYKDENTGTYELSISEIPDEGLEDSTQNITVLPVNSAGAYRQRITISNTLPTTLNEYQVSLTIDTASLIASGEMNIDGSDILFFDTDDLTILPYWIESGINTTSTKIWIKIPSIPNGNKDIFIYYGNPSALPSQNGTLTFDFFDNFDNFNSDTWEKTDISIDVSMGRALISNGSLYTKTPKLTSSTNEIVETKLKWLSSTGSYSGVMISDDVRTAGSNTEGDALVYYMTQSSNGDMNLAYWAANGLANSYNLGSGNASTYSLNTDTILGVSTTNENSIKIFKNYTNIITRTGSWSAPSYIWLGYFTGAAAGSSAIKPIEADWIRARKYAAVEPSLAIHSQESVISQIQFTSLEQSLTQDEISNELTIRTEALNGNPSNVLYDTEINLSTSSLGGRFSLDKNNWIDISKVTILSGQNSVSFYYRDTLSGSHILRAEETPSKGWIDAAQTINITRRSIVFTSTPKTVIQEIVSSPITIETRRLNGTPSPLGRDTLFQLTSSSETGEFSLTSQPFTPINEINVSANQTSFTFYYRDKTIGVHSLRVTENPSQNWIYGVQNIIVIPATDYFEVTANDTVLSGEPFTLTITAKKADGSVYENYKGTVSIIADYIEPSIGTFAVYPNTTSDFKKGIATQTITYDDAGIITCTVTDINNSKIIGTSNQILFIPAKFEIEPNSYDQVAAKPFKLKLRALSQKDETTPNFFRTINIEALQTSQNKQEEAKLYPQSASFNSGILELNNISFSHYGKIKIKLIDPLDTFTQSEHLSEEIFFHPLGFNVFLSSPPIKRDFYYLNEPFNVEISPYDNNLAILQNYTGTITIEKNDGIKIPLSKTFTLEDLGKCVLEASSHEEGEYFIKVFDNEFEEGKGISKNLKSKYAYIKPESKDLPLEESIVHLYIYDKNDKIITEDYSSLVMLKLYESNPNSSALINDKLLPIKIEGGASTFSISNNEEETVTVQLESEPYLEAKEGILNFIKNAINVGKGGLRILFWKEVRDDVS